VAWGILPVLKARKTGGASNSKQTALNYARMNRALRAILLLILATTARAEQPAKASPTTSPTDAFLDPAALHIIHLKLTQSDWDKIQPRRGNLFGNLFAASRPANEEPTHDSPFGYHYAFVHAAAEVAGQSFPDVGLRFKGNSSYLTAKELKTPFKLDLNHYDKSLNYAGLTSLNLNNNALDPTLMHEALAYQFFRDAGVPASRTSNALVYLSVEKLHDHKRLGLYTLVEEISKSFLKDHFGSAKGLLLKPENCFNLPYLGEKFDKYEKMYRPKSEGTPATRQRLIDFVKLIHQADDAAFDRQIDNYLDTAAFLRFVAANAAIANMDSFLSTGHNFYLYIHPDTLKAHFIPWDLNLAFGGFDWVGTIEEQADLSLNHPWVNPNRLTERLLKIDRYAKAYRAEYQRLTESCLSPANVRSRLTAAKDVITKAEKLANVPHRPLPPTLPKDYDLPTFLTHRLGSIQSQLAGKSEGYEPYWQKGFIGGRVKRPATQSTPK